MSISSSLFPSPALMKSDRVMVIIMLFMLLLLYSLLNVSLCKHFTYEDELY